MSSPRELSPRKARVCTKPDCSRRNFGDLGWVCPEHGSFHTVDQPDHPYFGQVPTMRGHDNAQSTRNT